MTNALGIESDTPETFARGLRRYIGNVAAALGVGLESCVIDSTTPASAYVALDVRLPRFPGRDLALLWDERFGWSAAVEAHCGEELLVLAYRGGELLATPKDVTRFVTDLRANRSTGTSAPPQIDVPTQQAMLRRVCDYAMPW